jgi:NADP-dependent 3-hydroxy acid dehydrogenase YdfG
VVRHEPVQVYCATKFAVHAFTEALREETAAAGVRCSIVASGVVETPLLSHGTNEAIKSGYRTWKSKELRDEPLVPEDVARSVMFIFSQPPHVCIREILLASVYQKS